MAAILVYFEVLYSYDDRALHTFGLFSFSSGSIKVIYTVITKHQTNIEDTDSLGDLIKDTLNQRGSSTITNLRTGSTTLSRSIVILLSLDRAIIL